MPIITVLVVCACVAVALISLFAGGDTTRSLEEVYARRQGAAPTDDASPSSDESKS